MYNVVENPEQFMQTTKKTPSFNGLCSVYDAMACFAMVGCLDVLMSLVYI